MDARAFLDGAASRTREAFGRERRLLTFEKYLDLFLQDPYPLGRSAVQYVVDAVDSFGVRKVPGIGGSSQRYGIWDAPFAGGRGAVHGQEEAQELGGHPCKLLLPLQPPQGGRYDFKVPGSALADASPGRSVVPPNLLSEMVACGAWR